MVLNGLLRSVWLLFKSNKNKDIRDKQDKKKKDLFFFKKKKTKPSKMMVFSIF
jgi:hypothetical protein